MNSAYLYHHLGLGDHIIANGMVRTLAKKYDVLYLFCKVHTFSNVSYMFRDLDNLKIIQMDDDQVKNFIRINPKNNYIIAGHAPFYSIYNRADNKLRIDEIFYKLADVPIENKFSEFLIPRDLEKEKEVFKKLELEEGEKFIFVHDDESRKRNITKNISKDIKIIKPSMDYLVFDFLYTIEKAEEIHCINSSFFCLIDCMGIQKENMYLHRYVIENTSDALLGNLRCNWKILD